jgi:hypothetical protein
MTPDPNQPAEGAAPNPAPATPTPPPGTPPATSLTGGTPPVAGDSSNPPPTPKAPAEYKFKAPEGKSFDDEVLKVYGGVAKELDLTQEDAQKVLDKVAPAIEARQLQQVDSVRKSWIDATAKDAEIGGDKLAENVKLATAAFQRFGTPALKEFLDSTGLGNHPELVRWALKVGKALSEDKPPVPPDGGGAVNENDRALAMFPTMRKK